MQFADLNLSEPILRALVAEGYTTATPIQAKAIPEVLAGRDVMGCAQTGTGKTAAFALPILHDLHTHPNPPQSGRPRVLVLCPTRELATQIDDGFRAYGANLRVRTTVIFGGVGQRPQADAVRRGVDICIATPGRLLDLMNQRLVDLRDVHTLVLDEADRMLDMGFIHDIRRITATLSKERQTLMFSATMPKEIRQLANDLLRNPVSVQVAAVSQTADNIEQSVFFVDKRNKPHLLAHLYNELPMARAIVFTRTKHGADKVVAALYKRGIRAEAIHGNKSQNARQRALSNFKAMKTPILVATDIASRGIDVDNITHVVNYDLTHEPETYIHRIGRTARAGASGHAISFCDQEEKTNLKQIERLIKRSLTVRSDHPAYPEGAQPAGRREDREERPHRHENRGGNRPQNRNGHSHEDQEQRPMNRSERRAQQFRNDRPQQAERQENAPQADRPQHSKPRRHESHATDTHAPRHDRKNPHQHPRQGTKPHTAKGHSQSGPAVASGGHPRAAHPVAGKPKFRGKPRQKRRF